MLSARSQWSAPRSVRSVQMTRRAAQLAVRNATRLTVMLPRAASVTWEKTNSRGSDEDIGILKTRIRIRTNCNSFPCLLKRAAFCLRNATHRWWNPGEGLLISARIRWKRSAIVQQMVCVWYLSAAHSAHDPLARPCKRVWRSHSALSAFKYAHGFERADVTLGLRPHFSHARTTRIHPSFTVSIRTKLFVSSYKNYIKSFIKISKLNLDLCIRKMMH